MRTWPIRKTVPLSNIHLSDFKLRLLQQGLTLATKVPTPDSRACQLRRKRSYPRETWPMSFMRDAIEEPSIEARPTSDLRRVVCD